MREILFKAKRIDNGEWVYGNYAFTDTNGEKHFIFQNKAFEHEVYKNTICQYTGLTDKNGNKIWENDIVKKHFYTDCDAFANSEEYTGIVKFRDCAWVIEFKRKSHMCTVAIVDTISYSHDVEYFEVIGNIFDNPELLEGSE